MMSVHYYAAHPDRAAESPRQPWLLDLEETVATVFDDVTFGCHPRLARLYRTLLAVEQQAPGTLEGLGFASGPEFQAMSGKLTEEPHRDCCADYSSIGTWVLPGSEAETAVSFLMDVSVPYDEVAKGLDPQTWDEVEGSAFQPMKFLGQDCSGASEAGQAAFPAQAGQSWSGVVREDFAYGCDFGSTGCTSFTNYLDFEVSSGSDAFFLSYGLCRSLSGRLVGGQAHGEGALLDDCGFTEAERLSDPPSPMTRVRGAKRLGFPPELCGSDGCRDNSVWFAELVLVDATAIALCARPGAVQRTCDTDVERIGVPPAERAAMCAAWDERINESNPD